MTKRVHINTFAHDVAKTLIEYQEVLIAVRDSGRTEDQSIEPVLTLSFKDIRKHLRRERFHQDTLIPALVERLEGWGLVIEERDTCLVITKPAEDLEVEFTSLKTMRQARDAYYAALEEVVDA